MSELDEVRLREALRVSEAEPVPSDAHPQPERLWDAVHGEVRGQELTDILEHLGTCSSCTQAWLLARELGHDESGSEQVLPLSPRKGRSTTVWAIVVAMAAALILAVWLPREQPRPDIVPGADYRGPLTAAIEPVPSLADGASVRRDDLVLQWRTEQSGRFDVTVMTESLDEVTQATGLGEPRFEVPAEALRALPGGTKLLWQVSQIRPDGGRVDSPTFTLTLQ